MRLLKKITAVCSALVVAGASLFCVAPASAEDTLPSWVENAAAGYLYFGIIDYTLAYYNATGASTPGALPLLCAQGALAYAYAHQSDVSPTYNFGSDRYFCGLTYNYVNGGGRLAAGSGYIASDCSYFGIQLNGTLDGGAEYSTYWLERADFSLGVNPSTLRVVRFGDGSTYISNWDGKPQGYYFPTSCDGDSWPTVIAASKSAVLTTSNTYSSDTQFRFYNGGLDIPALFSDLGVTGTDFPGDLAKLHDHFEETYPELPPEMYFYTDEVDPTDPSGCCCHHEITVNVDPTVNVEVNVDPTVNVEVNVEPTIVIENPLPSEWLETIPAETVENPFEELPTLEVENFTDILQDPEDTFPESSGFWWKNFELWIYDNARLWKYFLGLFTIGVVGFILRKLG